MPDRYESHCDDVIVTKTASNEVNNTIETFDFAATVLQTDKNHDDMGTRRFSTNSCLQTSSAEIQLHQNDIPTLLESFECDESN